MELLLRLLLLLSQQQQQLLLLLLNCAHLCSGICLGLQCAVVEFARNVIGWTDAHSTEADATTTHPVVCLVTATVTSAAAAVAVTTNAAARLDWCALL